MPSPIGALLDATQALHAGPNLELHQDAAGYQVTLAVPGVRIEDLSIEVANSGMRIAAKQRHVRFDRSLRLPKDADLEQVQANYADGLLSILVPRIAKTEPTQLVIQPADGMETDDGASGCYHFEVAAPGVRTEDLAVTLDGNVLRVAGETKGERHHAAIDQTLRLRENVDATRATVTYANGLLCFSVPLKESQDTQPRQLVIQAAAPRKVNVTASAEETSPAARNASLPSRPILLLCSDLCG